MQVAPHLVVLYDAVAIKDESHFIEGYIIVLEDDADSLMHIEPDLAIGERAFCMTTGRKPQYAGRVVPTVTLMKGILADEVRA